MISDPASVWSLIWNLSHCDLWVYRKAGPCCHVEDKSISVTEASFLVAKSLILIAEGTKNHE